MRKTHPDQGEFNTLNTTSLQQRDNSLASNRSWAIFFISVLGLYLEMLLIRWIGTEVRIFAYLQNTVLVACFLGLGLGCFTCYKPIQLRQALLPLALLLLLMAVPASREALGKTSELLSVTEGLVIWSPVQTSSVRESILFVALGLTLTFALMTLVVDMFVPLGRLLGRLMAEHPGTIWAYSVNIAGSLIGTWLFVLLSLFYLPPFVWFIVLAALAAFFIWKLREDRWVNLALIGVILILAWFAGQVPGAVQVTWSPYQKLAVNPFQQDVLGQNSFLVTVNNVGYQMILDLSEAHTTQNSQLFPPDMRGLSQYDIPLLLHPNPQSFLVVGAGSGNDVAGGVRANVKQITAVEIDPAIIQIGRSLHPEQPYSMPQVRVVNDDARSFFANTQEKYDVISFGLLDSHTTTAMTNARLDHYVYTKESIARAKDLLADGGIMVLTFEAQKPYIADRISRVLQEIFGQSPLAFRIPSTQYGLGGVMFISGDLNSAQRQIAANPRLSAYIASLQQENPLAFTNSTRITTDDWPYIYLEAPRIPVLYFLLAGLMALMVLFMTKRWQARAMISGWGKSHWHFFFLGAGFLLLEVQNISKASVVLGNTWEVNAVIVSGVLVMELCANWAAYRFPKISTRFAYIALISLCLALYFVDLAQFAFLPYFIKALVVGGLTTLPMFFSGLVFIRSFTRVTGKDQALGANLIGALVGAMLESVTFITGIKALLLIVGGLDLLSMVTLREEAKQAVPALSNSELAEEYTEEQS